MVDLLSFYGIQVFTVNPWIIKNFISLYQSYFYHPALLQDTVQVDQGFVHGIPKFLKYYVY